jgi:hypothetical protein
VRLSVHRPHDTSVAFNEAADKQKCYCRRIQLQASGTCPSISPGAFLVAAYRKDPTGIRKGSVPLFTDVRRA